MSRIGKMPIEVPSGVDIEINGTSVRVKGPKGELAHTFPPVVEFTNTDGNIVVTRLAEDKFTRSMHGTARAVLSNMVVGVSQGFEKRLEIHGVGYRAEMKGETLVLNVGYSHPVEFEPENGISFAVEGRNDQIIVRGHNKEEVGQIASLIRKKRPPEPYKGKGIRYQGERVRRKAGKAGKAA